MLKENKLKTKLKQGLPVIGTWSVIPSPTVTDIIASTGLDFIIIDAEHGPINFETAQQMAIVCESRAVTPIMRVSGVNQAEILKALDIGMYGIQVPNILNYKDIEKIDLYSKYPPLGNRGFSPFTRACEYDKANGEKLNQLANENLLTIIHIEGIDAVNNIDKILEYKSLDIIFIGLFDLSKALGLPGQVDSPEVQSILKSLTEKIRKANKFVGTIATSQKQLDSFIEMGVQYITYGVDCDMLRSSYAGLTPYEKK